MGAEAVVATDRRIPHQGALLAMEPLDLGATAVDLISDIPPSRPGAGKSYF